jgi:hypothetical protein
MTTCPECVHFGVCEYYAKSLLEFFDVGADEMQELLENCRQDEDDVCEHFLASNRVVELPDVGDYDTVTTIDEALDHCYQIATSTDETVCAECKAEHMRLCGWLGELKRRITAEQALEEREANGQSQN